MKKWTYLLPAALLSSSLLQAQNTLTYRIDTTQPQQTIDCFSASDAWSMNRIGLWADSVQQQVADWLFSQKNDDKGQPLGIGLSMWRFNLGAGSAEQGEAAQINRSTRTECLLNADGSYDWTKQAGQRNFLRLAKERGVDQFLAFLNSPPVYFTQNGLATNTGRGGTYNLKEDCYDDFAQFIATALQGIEEHDGIHFNYISPVNEPDGHWNWLGPKQEGTPATDREIARAIRLISKEFVDRGMTTQIILPEASDYRCMWGTHQTDWQRGYHIPAFFCPDSTATYLGDTPLVPRLMAAHSYWTTTPLNNLRGFRERLRKEMERFNVDFWQSEICIMGNDEEIGGGGGYDFTMKTALYVARIIHHDLRFANARSWQWWRAVGGDYKDGLLREYSQRELRRAGRNEGGARGNNGRSGIESAHSGEETGLVRDSKLLWALGNYSRFIRPQAVRLAIETRDAKNHVVTDGDTDPTGLMATAYRNADGSMVMVVINYADKAGRVQIAPTGKAKSTWKMFRTSDENNEHITPVGSVRSGEATEIPARSIVTLVSAK